MKKIYYNIGFSGLLMTCLFLMSCGKDYLELKQNKRTVTPNTIADYQAILDNAYAIMNSNSTHELGVIGSDEYYIAEGAWSALTQPYQKNGYIWADEVYEGQTVADWNTAYQRVLYANTALEGMAAITPAPNEQETWNNVKGSALFFRAFNFFQLAQEFCKPYNEASADTDPGIPLRLASDVNLSVNRSSLLETYQQIIEDLLKAEALLPDLPEKNTRPSKAAVYALLARVCLNMEDYIKAADYAGRSLAIKDDLIDFNTLNLTDNPEDRTLLFPEWGAGNPEVLFFSFMAGVTVVDFFRMNVDSTLLDLYNKGDLRRAAYYFIYGGRNVYKGAYSGNYGLFFTGLATDEMYLIAAESLIRTDRVAEGMQLLELLLEKRIAGHEALHMSNQEEALRMVLEERRKELVFRGTRWEDLRRLNKDVRFAKRLIRNLGDKVYELEPNSSKYVWPIPHDVIAISGVEQNER